MSSQDELIKAGLAAVLAVVAIVSLAVKGIDYKAKYRKKDGTLKEVRVKIRFRKPAETAEAMAKLWKEVAKNLGVPVSAIVSVSQLKPAA